MLSLVVLTIMRRIKIENNTIDIGLYLITYVAVRNRLNDVVIATQYTQTVGRVGSLHALPTGFST